MVVLIYYNYHFHYYLTKKGYYEMPEKTAEDYKVINGIKYFCTGKDYKT